MFKDKILRKVLMGNTDGITGQGKSRVSILTIPSNGEESARTITYMTSDGLILYFIRKIEALEKKVGLLEAKKNK